MSTKNNYKEAVIKSVNNEYEKFKDKELSKTPEQIFEDCRRIYFNREIADFLVSDPNDMPEKHYRCLYEDRGIVLGSLWDFFINLERVTVDTYDEIDELVKSYNEYKYSHILANQIEM